MLTYTYKIDRGYIDIKFDFSGACECVAECAAAQLASRLWVHLGDGRVSHYAGLCPRSVRVLCDAGDYVSDDPWLTKLVARELLASVRFARRAWAVRNGKAEPIGLNYKARKF